MATGTPPTSTPVREPRLDVAVTDPLVGQPLPTIPAASPSDPAPQDAVAPNPEPPVTTVPAQADDSDPFAALHKTNDPDPIDDDETWAKQQKAKQDQAADNSARFLAWKATNAGVDSKTATDVLRLSQVLNKPPEYVAANLEASRKAVGELNPDWGDVVRTAPALTKLLNENGINAAAVKDDIKPLSLLEQVVTDPITALYSVPEAAIDATMQQVALGREYLAMRGVTSSTPADYASIDAQMEKYSGKDLEAKSYIGKAILGVPKLAPVVLLDKLFALGGGAIGRGVAPIAAIIAGGGPENPAADVGGGAAAMVGEQIGEKVGSFAFNTAENSAMIHMALRKVRDDQGRPLDPALVNHASDIAGTTIGAVMAMTGGPLGAGLIRQGEKDTLQKLGMELAQKTILEKGPGAVLAFGLKRFGAHWLTGAGMMALQSGIAQGAEEATRYLAGESYGARGERVLEAVKGSFVQGLEDMPLVAAYGAHQDVAQELGRARASKQDADRIRAIASAAKASTTVEQNPGFVEQLAKGVTAQPGGSPHALMDLGAWDKLWQGDDGKGAVNPREAWKTVAGDDGKGYDEAKNTGGELVLPIEKYIPFSRTEHAAKLADDTRLNQNTLTPRQQREANEKHQARVKELAKVEPDAMDQAARRVYDDVLKRNLASGYDKQAAEATAKLTAASLQSWAEQFQAKGSASTAWDIYRLQDYLVHGAKGQGLGPLAETRELDLKARAAQETPAEQEELDTSFDFGANAPEHPTIDVARKEFEGHLDAPETEVALRRHFEDPVTGVRNEKAAALEPTTEPAMLHFGVEGTKFRNDDIAKGGHQKADELLRSVAQAGHAIDPRIYRAGGDFAVPVKDEAAGQAFLKTVRASLPGEAKGYEVTGAVGSDLEAARIAHDKLKIAAEEAGTRAPRGARPLGLPEGHDAGTEIPSAKVKSELGPEHRANFAERTSTPEGREEVFKENHVEAKTGLLTKRGYDALPPKKYRASIDLNGLKRVQERLAKEIGKEDAHAFGDLMLERFGRLAKNNGGLEFDFTHDHGDEYLAQHDDEDLLKGFLKKLNKLAIDSVVEMPVPAKGGRYTYKELRFGFGTSEASNERLAEQRLNEHKAKLLVDGHRGNEDQPGRLDFTHDDAGGPHADDDQGRGHRDVSPGHDAAGGEGGAPGDRGEVRPAGDRARGEEAAHPEDGARGAGQGRVRQHRDELHVAPEVKLASTFVVPTEKEMAGAAAMAAKLKSPERRAAVEGFLAHVRDHLAGKESGFKLADLPRDLELRLANEFGITDPQHGFATTEDLQHASRGGERKRKDITARDTGQAEKAREFKARRGEVDALDQPAWHGGPHDFDKFSTQHIGTGEGAQVYGHGLYFADKREVAESYRIGLAGVGVKGWERPSDSQRVVLENLPHYTNTDGQFVPGGQANLVSHLQREARRLALFENDPEALRQAAAYQDAIDVAKAMDPSAIERAKGQLFHVEIPDAHELLDYDKPLDKQPPELLERLRAFAGSGRADDGASAYLRRLLREESSEVTGGELYETLAADVGPKRASEVLNSIGIPGLRYLDQGSRGAGEGSHNYVIWDDSRVSIKDKLYQPPEGGDFHLESNGARAFISFTPPGGEGRRVFDIHLLEKADKTSLAHETFHFLAEVMGDLAQRDDAPEQLKQDYAGLIKFAGYDSHEQRLAEGQERRDLGAKEQRSELEAARLKHLTAKEERITHAWEQFLMEGKAPSAALVGAFTRFRAWFTQVYKSILGLQDNFRRTYGEEINLSDTVREIFGRILASDREIERQKAAEVQAKPFENLAAKMSPEDRAAYEKVTAQAVEGAKTEMVRRVAEAQRRENSKFMGEERERLRTQVEGELDKNPTYRALRYLQDGELPEGELPALLKDKDGNPFKLDRKALVEKYGPEFVRTMPRKVFSGRGAEGVGADELASVMGFDSGDAMVRSLQQAKPRAAYVEGEVQQRMEGLYGPALLDNPQQLATEAIDSLHNETAIHKALLERRALAKQLNPSRAGHALDLDVDVLKDTARRLVAEKTVGDLTAGEQGAAGYYLRAERTAAKRALEAAEAGKLDKALAFNESQILSSFLWRAAKDARDTLEKQRDLLERSAQDPWRGTLGKADVAAADSTKAYRDAHDAILQAIRIAPAATDGSKPSLDALFDRAQADAQDLAFDVDAIRELVAKPQDWKELTSEQAQNVVDAVKNIRKAANARNEVALGERRILKDTFFKSLDRELAGLPETPLRERDRAALQGAEKVLSKARGLRSSLDALQTDFETLVDLLTGNNRDSVAHELLVDGYLEARNKKDELGHQFLEGLMKHWDDVPKELKDRLNDTVDLSDLPLPKDLGADSHIDANGKTSLKYALMIALNMGNAGNKQRLLGGYEWSEPQVLKALGRVIPKEGWDWVQGVFDSLESLYPHIARTHYEETGLELGKVEATPIKTPYGELRGGYFPAKYDPRSNSPVAIRQEESAVAKFFEPSYRRASTAKGHTKERAETYTDAINLDWGVVPSHVAQVLHDIAFRKWVKNAAGVIIDPRFKGAVTKYLGEDFAAQIDPWLKTAANGQADSVANEAQKWTGFLGYLRGKVAIQALGLNLPVAMTHLSIPASLATIGEVQPGFMASAVAKTMANWGEKRQFVLDNSPEMAHRNENVGGLLRDKLNEMGSVGSKWDRLMSHVAFSALEWGERLTSTPAWIGRYEQELAGGLSHEEAVREADAMVRRFYPAKDLAETPALLRTKGVLGGMVMFFGFMSKMRNVQRRWARDLNVQFRDEEAGVGDKIGEVAKFAGKTLAFSLTAGALGEWLAGKGQEKDESLAHYLFRRVLTFQAGLTPFLGDAVDGLLFKKGGSIRQTPGIALAQHASQMIGDFAKSDHNDRKILDALELLGFATNLPTQPLRKAGGYLMSDARPRGALDAAGGMVYGHTKAEPGNPLTAAQTAVSGGE